MVTISPHFIFFWRSLSILENIWGELFLFLGDEDPKKKKIQLEDAYRCNNEVVGSTGLTFQENTENLT